MIKSCEAFPFYFYAIVNTLNYYLIIDQLLLDY